MAHLSRGMTCCWMRPGGFLSPFRHLWAASWIGQTESRQRGRLVAQNRVPAQIFSSRGKKTPLPWAGELFALPPHILQDVATPDHDSGLAAGDDTLVLQPLEADRDPLPRRADHVGEIGV